MKYKNRLAELRGNMSQSEFAKKLGLTQQNYWKYENGHQGLRSDLIEKICTEFNCSAEWLLCLDLKPINTINKDAKTEHKTYEFITDDEKEIIDLYRSLSPFWKQTVLAGLKEFAYEKEENDSKQTD